MLISPPGCVVWYREQDERAERQRQRRERGSSFGDPGTAVDDGLGSFDDGDPFTTNLYVGNLATTVDEEVPPPNRCRRRPHIPDSAFCQLSPQHNTATLSPRFFGSKHPYITNLHVSNLASWRTEKGMDQDPPEATWPPRWTKSGHPFPLPPFLPHSPSFLLYQITMNVSTDTWHTGWPSLEHQHVPVSKKLVRADKMGVFPFPHD